MEIMKRDATEKRSIVISSVFAEEDHEGAKEV
jgi:hypothetical protein